MKHGSLFSGIGGFDLAAEWMGWENVFHCEINDFGKRILKHYWPNSISYDDIKQTDFTIHRGRIDIISGGFPCQPYSSAGRRQGKEDDRHLWPQMCRAIREIQPSWIVGENVFGIITWNEGLVFNEVQADLEAEGYEVFPYVLPACAVNGGAPHRRDRVWFVAHSSSSRHRGSTEKNRPNFTGQKRDVLSNFGHNGNEIRSEVERCSKTSTNSERIGLRKCEEARSLQQDEGKVGAKGNQFTNASKTDSCDGKPDWRNFPTQSPICSGDDGLPTKLDGITFSKWRTESIKGYGNAVVPQIPYTIFKAIADFENQSV